MTTKNFEFLEIPRKAPTERWAPERIEDFNEISSQYSDNESKIQASRCIDCGIPYCQFQCPVENHIPQWLKLVEEGRIFEAARLSHETNSLPEICGQVCPKDRLCEGSCTLNEGFGAVNIGSIERYITDKAFELGWEPDLSYVQPSGKTVAIIGAGPSGLGCADILTRNGVKPVVFDDQPQIGGLLTFGIPSFKLEKQVIEKRRSVLENMGVEFRLNTNVGTDVTFGELYEKYDAVFMAVGAYNKKKAKIPGENLPGVHQALDYLINNIHYQLGKIPQEDNINFYFDRTIILGGGDTAMDCSRTAVRQQASSVYCAYRRNMESMPGSKAEVRKAREEGVKFLCQYQPIEIVGETKVEGVKFARTQLSEPDASGRQKPEIIEGSECFVPAEHVVIAFGFDPHEISWLDDYKISTNPKGLVHAKQVNKHPFQTSNDKVFAGGDIVRGADLVVTAIFEGRSAAKSIMNYLGVN